MKTLRDHLPLMGAIVIAIGTAFWWVSETGKYRGLAREVKILRSIAGAPGTAVVACDLKGNFTYWSADAEELTGYLEHEMVSYPIETLMNNPEKIQRHRAAFGKAAGLKGSHAQEVRCNMLRKDGSSLKLRLLVWKVEGGFKALMSDMDQVERLGEYDGDSD